MSHVEPPPAPPGPAVPPGSSASIPLPPPPGSPHIPSYCLTPHCSPPQHPNPSRVPPLPGAADLRPCQGTLRATLHLSLQGHPTYVPTGAPHIPPPLLGTRIPPRQGLRIPSRQGSLFPTLLQVPPIPPPLGHPTTHTSHPHQPVGHPVSPRQEVPLIPVRVDGPHPVPPRERSPSTRHPDSGVLVVPGPAGGMLAGEGRQPECLPAGPRRQELTLPGLIWKSPSHT